ncbi:MAG: pyridoxamine 5'-phosphate oxidase family protein [Egibacteraceae bacterium]
MSMDDPRFADAGGEPVPFEEIREDFLRFTAAIVLCTVTTVDERSRPRSRMLHPIFTERDGRPVGWVLTAPTALKVRHLAHSPYVACSYWSPAQNVVYADCIATWVADQDEKDAVYDLFLTTPPPLGYGDEGMAGFGPDGPRSALFTPLRLDPWRIQVLRGEEYPMGNMVPKKWRATSSSLPSGSTGPCG